MAKFLARHRCSTSAQEQMAPITTHTDMRGAINDASRDRKHTLRVLDVVRAG